VFTFKAHRPAKGLRKEGAPAAVPSGQVPAFHAHEVDAAVSGVATAAKGVQGSQGHLNSMGWAAADEVAAMLGSNLLGGSAAGGQHEQQDDAVLHIYYGDRWNYDGPGSVGNASYMWLPLLPPASARASAASAGSAAAAGVLGYGGRAGAAGRDAHQGALAWCMRVATGLQEQEQCRQWAAQRGGAATAGTAAAPPVHFQLRFLDEWRITDFLGADVAT
jgi:hypothetical protein